MPVPRCETRPNGLIQAAMVERRQAHAVLTGARRKKVFLNAAQASNRYPLVVRN